MRRLSFFVVIILFPTMVISQELQLLDYSASPVITEPVSGDYAIYRNTIESQEKIYTILFLEENRYFVQVRNIDTQEIIELNITFGIKDGKFGITELLLLSGDKDSKGLEHVQVDLFNIIVHRLQQDISTFPKAVVSEQRIKEYNYSFLYDYRYWVPFYNLYSRSVLGAPDKRMSLIRFGRLREGNMEEILEFTGIDTSVDTGPTMDIDEKEYMEVSYDNITLPLDENWEAAENNTAIIRKGEEVYAYIRIVSFPKEVFDINPYVYFSENLMNSISYILPVTVVVDTYKQYPILKYVEYNTDLGRKNQVIIQFFDRGEGISILQFSTSKKIYDDNQSYFNAILF